MFILGLLLYVVFGVPVLLMGLYVVLIHFQLVFAVFVIFLMLALIAPPDP